MIIILNKIDGSTDVVKNILQSDKTRNVNHSITVEFNFPLVTRRWIIWSKASPFRYRNK